MNDGNTLIFRPPRLLHQLAKVIRIAGQQQGGSGRFESGGRYHGVDSTTVT